MGECPDCEQYAKQVKGLKDQLDLVQFQLRDLQSQVFKKSKKKSPHRDDNLPNPKPKKKKGGIFGHVGWFRKKPKTIDRIEEVRLSACPHCECEKLGKCLGHDDNNHAEQQIRPNVILRKITNGSRSYDEAKVHSICTSILQTAKTAFSP